MGRNLFPAVFAIGMGIVSGYYTFQPSFQELQSERENTQRPNTTTGQSLDQKTAAAPSPAPTKEDTNAGTNK
ncbi:uncharacterized protein BDW47DRAFT_123720 [Aspergillus candidus]|uniref:Uncharacterized protein n=1 Tax=Aspergillus candidus TaxID=41067 RepID=A0A2I2FHW9_ASPCN|nr:hypothetical protein BDW47DRAFT_123720 [Aspergillus candidus]PLB40210.1 hypothetical protein BDW47DRAFT_123720 [Aspergillus candidus]